MICLLVLCVCLTCFSDGGLLKLGSSPVEISTGDGVSIGFAGSSACIDHVSIDGHTLAGANDCQYGLRVWEHSSFPLTEELLENGNFSAGDSLATSWTPVGGGYARVGGAECRQGQHCVRVQNNLPTTEVGAMQVWTHVAGQPYPSRIAISGWMRAQNMSGEADALFSVYCDITYEDGDHYWAATAVGNPLGDTYTRSLRVVSLAKPLKSFSVYALLRGHVGVAWFDSLSVSVLQVYAANVSLTATSPTLVSVSGPLSPTLALAANYSADRRAVSISAVVSAPASASGRGLTIELALPLNGTGWASSQSLDDPTVLPEGFGAVGSGIVLDGLPGPLDDYPIFHVQHPGLGLGLAVVLPMTTNSTVRACRSVYLAARAELLLSCDYYLSNVSLAFPSLVPFTAVVFKLDHPAWGLRAGLDKYYQLFPEAFDASSVRTQGNWLPFISNISGIANVTDFGLRYQEGAGDAASCQDLNRHGMAIYPYIEPHFVHWPLPPGQPVDQAHVAASIDDCVAHPDKYPPVQQHDCVAVQTYAARDGAGLLVWVPEIAPWNTGAMFILDINAAFAGDPASRCAMELQVVANELDNAARGNYTLGGIYIDSTDGGQLLLNYNVLSLAWSRSPLLVDVHGAPTSLVAAGTLSFLQHLRDNLASRGQGLNLMGNTLYVLPHLQFAALFAVAGIETNWHPDPTAATLSPPPRSAMLLQRSMAAQRPYIFLQNTDFDGWTYAMTEQYFQVCLSLGLWASFFSYNAADHQYFANASLYNRDRPLFQTYTPILRALNMAGWQPATQASIAAAWPPASNRVYVERFGPRENSSVFFTVRNEGRADLQEGIHLTVNATACGLQDGAYVVQELVSSRMLRVEVVQGLVDIYLAANTTGAPIIGNTLVLSLSRAGTGGAVVV